MVGSASGKTLVKQASINHAETSLIKHHDMLVKLPRKGARLS
jgi:hypothetical protein